MASKIDTIVNIATLVTCGAIAVTLLRMPRPLERPEPYKKGDTVAAIDRRHFAGTDQTVLLVLRNGCRYCAESMPFYRRLIEGRSEGGARRTRFVGVVLMERDHDAATRYIAENRLAVDDVLILSREAPSLKVVGTPTILVTDARGIVTSHWTGKLDTEEENRVVTTLFPPAEPARSSAALGSTFMPRPLQDVRRR